LPSVGTSRGILVAWKDTLFTANTISSNTFGITFCSRHNNTKWTLICVYAPCTLEGRDDFLAWFKNLNLDSASDWIILGYFNLIRKPKNRNRPGGDLNNMFKFNEAISFLGINEITLQGRKFTWSNMQPSPLLEKLDWVFTSNSWAISYPSTHMTALDMTPSDHCMRD